MKSKNPKKLPCMCGHIYAKHGTRELIVERPNILGICWTCQYDKDREIQLNSVHDFKLDNLKYIEWLAAKKKLV